MNSFAKLVSTMWSKLIKVLLYTIIKHTCKAVQYSCVWCRLRNQKPTYLDLSNYTSWKRPHDVHFLLSVCNFIYICVFNQHHTQLLCPAFKCICSPFYFRPHILYWFYKLINCKVWDFLIHLAVESYVYWTVHHCDSWGIKDQLDVTCYFISLLMCS